MHAITLIARAIDPARCHPLPEPPADGVCCITGLRVPTIARKKLLGKSFMDGAVLAAPSSDRVSVDAWRVFTFNEDRGKKRGYFPERQSSWLCDGNTLTLLDRQGVRGYVLSAPAAPHWCGYATTSYKKHGSLRAPVNSGTRAVWLWETRLVDCTDRVRVAEWWARLNAALRLGFGRNVLESLDCPEFMLAKYGWREWMEFERWARPVHQSALYQFLCYLLPSQEELSRENSDA